MKGYVKNIEEETKQNENFRKVIYTAPNSQLVLMSLRPGEDIGEEVHELDQFFRIEEGEGKVVIDDMEHEIKDDFAIVIPQGTKHNIINTSQTEKLKLYTIYSPPNHKDGTVHKTKEQAESEEEEFDGMTTEE